MKIISHLEYKKDENQMSLYKLRFIGITIVLLHFSAVDDPFVIAQSVDTKQVLSGSKKKKNATTQKQRKTDTAKSKKKQKISSKQEQEKMALAFVALHSPEVSKLLKRLKSKNKRNRQYAKAIKELAHTYKRLEAWKTRDSARYQLELELWKINSKIKLIIARASTSKNSAYQIKLKKAVAQRMDLRIQTMTLNHENVLRRAKKQEQKIQAAKKYREKQINSQAKALIKTVEKSRQQRDSTKLATKKKGPKKTNQKNIKKSQNKPNPSKTTLP